VASATSARSIGAKSDRSTPFGTTVIFSGGMPRERISAASPSQMVVTASARASTRLSSQRDRR
jgi:hypothetical protein